MGESVDIKTPSLQMSVKKLKAENLSSTIEINDVRVVLPSFCELLNEPVVTTMSPSTTTTQSPLGPLYNPSVENNCKNRPITFKVKLNFILRINKKIAKIT